MAIQGLQHTASMDAIPATGIAERPLNWRQGILMRFPNGHAPLTALTSVMKTRSCDDPQFHWWEREMSQTRLEIDTAITNVATVVPIVAGASGQGGAFQVKIGDILYVEENGELMKVTTAVTADNSLPGVERGYAGTTNLALDPAVAGTNPFVVIIGSVYEEGADTPESVRYRPSKQFNFTQIFRNSLKASRTAMHTRLRTMDEIRDAKQQALLYHSIGMEYGFIFGSRNEEASSGGEPERMTGGVISFIPAANVVDNAGAGFSMKDLEDNLLEAFRFGSQEKVGFCGNRALLAIQRMARLNSSLEITPTIKEFGMDVRRVFSPSGTLVLKTHPLFNQIQSTPAAGTPYYSFDSWLLICDMANLTYRPLRNSDTQYLPDRQSNGRDAITSEYLTECGLEIAHGKTHYLIKGLVDGAVDA